MAHRRTRKFTPVTGRPAYPRFVGQNGAGGAGAGGGLLSSFPSFASVAAVIGVVVAVTAAIGVGVSTGFWVANVHKLDDKADDNRALIEDLEAQLIAINSTIPTGNGTTFFDDTWVMARGVAPARQFMFNNSLITTVAPGAKRNYAMPDTDGVVALQETLPTAFAENLFSIFGSPDPSKSIEFDLSLLSAAAFRLYSWPNKNGVVAMISDVVAVAGNTSVFLDATFAIENDPDTTKRAMFDASAISTNTNRTYGFPDLDGTLCLTTGAQTLSDKLLSNSTVSDSTVSDSTVSNSTLDTSNTVAVLDTRFQIEDDATGEVAQLQCDLLGGPQNYSFPDLSGTFLLETGNQTVSDKTLDPSNTATLLDTGFTLLAVPGNLSRSAQFQANNLTQPRVYEFPDQDGTLALLSDVPTLTITSGTWVPVFSAQVSYTGTAVTVVGTPSYIQIGNRVSCWLRINGLFNPGFVTTASIRMSLPVAPSGNFADTSRAAGTATARSGATGQSAGTVTSTTGTVLVLIETRNEHNTGGSIAIMVSFGYTLT